MAALARRVRSRSSRTLWGATKIHGELLKLGIEVAQSTVSIYMVPRRDRPLQTWKTFLRNHMDGIASIDLFIVLTIAFQHSLEKDPPLSRRFSGSGRITSHALLGGLHHHYCRI
jgi:hypothetical protein